MVEAKCQVALLEAGEELHHVRRRLPVVVVFDARAVAGRVGEGGVLKRHRDVDNPAGHCCASFVMPALVAGISVFQKV
jgi:hypothetical protein